MPNSFSGIWKIGSNDNINNSSKLNDSSLIDDSIRNDETYHQYGLRICGRVTGSLPTLTPYISKIYDDEKRKQHQNEEVQQNLRNQISQKIVEVEGDIAKKEHQKNGIDIKIEDLQNKQQDANNALQDAKAKDGEINKMARMKLITGLFIIAILSVYLFIFYSSTFYSAFLFQPSQGSEISLGMAMLNSSAIPEAFRMGFGSFIFIITAPIIFMALGYCLHFFMVQKGGIKWFKIIALLVITFSFDCILAYKIGEVIYNYIALTKLEIMPDYSLEIAIKDINSWAVIFCGFIVYLIWGIVFDMIMTAYEELRSNKHEIESLLNKINEYKNIIAGLKQEFIELEGEIGRLISVKDGLQNRMNNAILVDHTKIRNAISDFFAGWMNMMSALGYSPEHQMQAQQIYDTTINQLFNN